MTTIEEWQAWMREGCNTLPLLRRIPLAEGEDRPEVWTGAWEHAYPHSIVLESGKDGRYTYLGLRPSAVLTGKGMEATLVTIEENESDWCTNSTNHKRANPLERCDDDRNPATLSKHGAPRRLTGKPLDVIRAWMAGRKGPSLPDGPKWTGGIAGMLAYDIARSIERLPELAVDDLGLPDYLFLQLDELWIIDHEKRELVCACHTYVSEAVQSAQLAPEAIQLTPGAPEVNLTALYELAVQRTEQMTHIWHNIVAASRTPKVQHRLAARRVDINQDQLHIDIEQLAGLIRPFSKQSYMDAVERIREYIAQGDVFQVNLSQRMSKHSEADADDLYEWLRLFNPSPYMGNLRCPDFQLVSASPELLVTLRDGKLSTRPIAGTRRRGRTPEEDHAMAEELLSSEKERAEHIMLVDLERNDFGRIAQYGSVKVKELLTIEYYSHVMHLVSQVEAQLAVDKDAFDVIAAVFPGGTITGAPKIRTMEILEELEPTRRGPYYGSLGFIDYSGDMEFNILIRTMVVKDNMIHIQAGGGIVIDADPEREYYESLNKAKALWKAVQYAEREAAAAQTQTARGENR